MNNRNFIYCYKCNKSITSNEKGLQYLIHLYGDYYTCSCGNKIKLRMIKYDWRKFKLRKIKNKIKKN